ncbi:MSS1/TRME-RELATED GTP-BINDING PROTEIN [Salix koriyanagi]|uniref:MSS1/TRME-RELATED GTP-BINDING PROTEIN n=1 Tax=Salix koriyanagi TaxID=2511006 RepID=A0A9Q0W3C3_9ROSI|nr:MSS1/TRME-RELATED GTP-BINDING PROTEIN [Salix koriyanagi]
MALSRLPKMIFSMFTHPLPSPYTHISLPLITKLKIPILSRLKSTFATTELIPITEAHNLLALQEQTHSKFSPDKLFIPPDTEVSVNENSSGLRARVLKGSNIVLRKTQCINHFKVNDSWYLVDLPGFGYASAPRELRTDWNKFTKNYFLNRSTLVSVFLLIDASIPAKKIDLEYASWLGQNQVPMTLIFHQMRQAEEEKMEGKGLKKM